MYRNVCVFICKNTDKCIPKSADLIEVVSKAALSDNESAIIVAFHCVYWLASEDLPMHKYGSMINLLKILNCWYVDKLCHSQTATYNSETTANDMLESWNECVGIDTPGINN
jgi:hypothetical protein